MSIMTKKGDINTKKIYYDNNIISRIYYRDEIVWDTSGIILNNGYNPNYPNIDRITKSLVQQNAIFRKDGYQYIYQPINNNTNNWAGILFNLSAMELPNAQYAKVHIKTVSGIGNIYYDIAYSTTDITNFNDLVWRPGATYPSAQITTAGSELIYNLSTLTPPLQNYYWIAICIIDSNIGETGMEFIVDYIEIY